MRRGTRPQAVIDRAGQAPEGDGLTQVPAGFGRSGSGKSTLLVQIGRGFQGLIESDLGPDPNRVPRDRHL